MLVICKPRCSRLLKSAPRSLLRKRPAQDLRRGMTFLSRLCAKLAEKSWTRKTQESLLTRKCSYKNSFCSPFTPESSSFSRSCETLFPISAFILSSDRSTLIQRPSFKSDLIEWNQESVFSCLRL